MARLSSKSSADLWFEGFASRCRVKLAQWQKRDGRTRERVCLLWWHSSAQTWQKYVLISIFVSLRLWANRKAQDSNGGYLRYVAHCTTYFSLVTVGGHNCVLKKTWFKHQGNSFSIFFPAILVYSQLVLRHRRSSRVPHHILSKSSTTNSSHFLVWICLMASFNRNYICFPKFDCISRPRGKAVSESTMLNYLRKANTIRSITGLRPLSRVPKHSDAAAILKLYEVLLQSLSYIQVWTRKPVFKPNG